MKRAGHLYERYVDRHNFEVALVNASKKKMKRKSVVYCYEHKDEVYHRILETTNCSGDYVRKTIRDVSSGKVRNILIPRFEPYQIMHHMIVNVAYPYLFRGAYRYSCGSIKDKGGLYASQYLHRSLSEDIKGTKWYCKLDIRHFYDNVDHARLKAKFRRVIKDSRFLALMDSVVDSVEGGKGLPIGNYTSQIFANYFLQDLDHYIKDTLKVPYYLRYMDDIILLDSNKRKLERKVKQVKDFLKKEGLETHGNEQVLEIGSNGDGGNFIDFVGYRHYRGTTTIRRRNFKRIRRCVIRCIRWIGHVPLFYLRRLFSYWGLIVHSDSWGFRSKYGLESALGALRIELKKENLLCKTN